MTLPPLRWMAEEPAVYDEAANTLHRPECPDAAGRPLAAGESVALVWAPIVCRACQPRVLLGLGAD